MERKDMEPFLNKVVSFTYNDPIDGPTFRKGTLLVISNSAITIEHRGQKQAYSLSEILRIREAGV